MEGWSRMEKILNKSERTRRRILDATAVCFSLIGIEKTSITQIAQQAETSRALVAHYFPVKDDMFIEVVRHLSKKFGEELKNTRVAGESRLVSHLRANLNFFIDTPENFKTFFLFYYYASLRQDYRELNTRMTEQTLNRFAVDLCDHSLEEGRSMPIEQARLVAAMIHRELIGSIQQYFITEHHSDPVVFKKQVIQACLKLCSDSI